MANLPYISPEVIQAYQKELQGSASPATAKRKSASLKRFFEWAQKEGYAENNPTNQPQIQPLTVTATPKRKLLTAGNLARVGFLSGLIILIFLIGKNLKLPIQFLPAPASETGRVSPSPIAQVQTPTPETVPETVKLEETDPLFSSIYENGILTLEGESPALKGIGGLLIESDKVTIKTTDGSSGNIEINPDWGGIAQFLFEGSGKNFLNAQAPNLTAGSLYYGIVANNSIGYNLINLQSGSKPITQFSVDAIGGTIINGSLNLTGGDLQFGGLTRLNHAGQLNFITGYYQNSGKFEIEQGPADLVGITKDLSGLEGPATKDSVILNLTETGSVGSNYDTLVLKRLGGTADSMALFVDDGNARFDGQLQVGRFSSNPSAIGQGSLVFNTTDTTLYFWNGNAWSALAGGSVSGFWQRISGVLSPLTTPDDLAIGGTDSSAPFFVNDSGNLTALGRAAIGSASSINTSRTLNVEETYTATSGTLSSVFAHIIPNPSADSSASFRGITGLADAFVNNPSSTANITGIIAGGRFIGEHHGAGTASVLYGTNNVASNAGAGTVANLYGSWSELHNSGTVTNAYSFVARNSATNSGSISNLYGLSVRNPSNTGGSINSAAGIAIENLTSATNNTNLLIGTSTIPSGNFSIYNSSTNFNYFAGRVGIADTSPDASLEILSTTEQLRLSHIDDTFDARFAVDGSGYLTINTDGSSSGRIIVGSGTASITPDLFVVDKKSDAGNPTGATGAIFINSSDKFMIYEGNAWKEVCNKSDQACGTGTGSAWSALTDPGGNLSLNHNDWTTSFNWNTAGDNIRDYFALGITNDLVTDTTSQRLLTLSNSDDALSTGTTEALLALENGDANEAVTNAILFGAGGVASPDFTNGINFDAADLATEIVLENAETIANQTDGTITLGASSGAISLSLSGTSASISTTAGDLTIDPTGNTIIRGSTADSTTAALNVQNSTPTSLLYVRNDGNVGIGTTSPGVRLHVSGSGGDVATFSRSDAGISEVNINAQASNQVGLVFQKGSVDKWAIYSPSTADDLRFYDTGDRLTIQAGGNVGIGITNPGYPLDVQKTFSSGTAYATNSIAATNNSSLLAFGAGIFGELLMTGTAGVSNGSGGQFTGIITGSSPATANISGVQINASSSVPASSINGVLSSLSNNSAALLGNLFGLRINNVTNNGTITNTYGVYVGDITIGTQTNTPYSIYSSDADSYNYLAGNVGVGTTAPDSKLHIVGGDTYVAPDTGYTFNNPSANEDLYVFGNLEVDGTIYGATAFTCTDCINADDLADVIDFDTASETSWTLQANNATTQSVFTLTTDGLTAGVGTTFDLTATGVTTAFSGDLVRLNQAQTYTGGAGTQSGNVLDIARSITRDITTAGDLALSGALATISDTAATTGAGTGTLTHSADVLRIAQNYTSNTGSALNMTSAGGATGFALRVNDDGTFTDSTAFVVNNSGNVGIGTTSPARRFHVPWLSGDTTSTTYFGSTDASNNQPAIYAESNSAQGVFGSSVSYAGVFGTTTTGQGVYGLSSSTGTPLVGLTTDTGTTNVAPGLLVRHRTSGTPLAGFGTKLVFSMHSANNTDRDNAEIDSIWTDPADATRTSDLIFKTTNAAVTDERLRITGAGNVGIGTSNPGASLHINPTITATSDFTSFKSGIVYNGGTAMANWYGSYISSPTGTGTITNKYALVTEAGTGNVGIGTIVPNYRLDVNGEIAIRGGETIDDARMYIQASDNSNRFTIETDLDTTTNNDLLGFRSITTDDILVLRGNGNVGVGIANPDARLYLAAGTATRAPFKLTLGTNLTTPEAGAIEYDGTDLYFTTTTPTRRTICNNSGNCNTGGGAATLQSAYEAGNTITTSNARNISITLADTTTDAVFELTGGATSSGIMYRINDDGTFTDSTPFVIDGSGNVGVGIANPSNPIHVVGTTGASGVTATTANIYTSISGVSDALDYKGVMGDVTGAHNVAVGTMSVYGLFGKGKVRTANGRVANIYGAYGYAEGDVNTIDGLNVQNIYGLYGTSTLSGTPALSNNTISAYGVYGSSVITDPGLNLTNYGLYATASGGDTNYGLYSTVSAPSGGNAYAVYADAGVGAGTEYAGAFLNGNVGIGTTTPTNFKLEVAGNIGPNAAPTESSVSQSINIADSTSAYQAWSSMVISTDGFAFIPHLNGSGSIEVTKCNDATCSTATSTNLETNSAAQISGAIGTDGYPVMSYGFFVGAGDHDLRVAKCSDAACSGTVTYTTLDTTGDVGEYSAIAISADGMPIISYYDNTNDDLKVAKCSNTSCTAATITSLDTTNLVGDRTSIAIGTDGLAVIGYHDTTNGDLKVAKCLNITCSTATITTVDGSANNVGFVPSIAVPPDNLPVVRYQDFTASDLKVAKCVNTDCSGTATITTIDSGNITSEHGGISIGTDGFPIISYFDFAASDLRVAKCLNSNCSTVTSTLVETANDVGRDSAIAIGPDGLPIVRFHDNTNGDLRFISCANALCSQTTGGSFSGGSNLGSRGNFFNNVYAVNYWGRSYQINEFSDLAENYQSNDPSISAGDIVNIVQGITVEKTTVAYSNKVLGVVSANPGIVLGKDTGNIPVALAGRVPVKINTSSEPFEPGDPLTSSSEPGKAMRATRTGTIMGYALESWGPDLGKDQILMKVGVSWSDPDLYLTDLGNLKIVENQETNQKFSNQSSKYQLEDATEKVVERIGAFSDFVAANIKSGAIIAKDLSVSGIITASDFIAQNINAGSIETADFVSNKLSAFQGTIDNLLITNRLVSPVIETNLISPLADSDTIQVKGNLSIENNQKEEVASIDTSGNASFAGELSVAKVTADEIKQTSGMSLKEIENLLKQVEKDQNLLGQITTSSDSTTVTNLFVTETAAMTSLSLSQSLTLGSDMVIASTLDPTNKPINSINSLSAPLSLQSLAQAPVEIMAGKVKINTNGDVEIGGNLKVAGVIEATKAHLDELTTQKLIVANPPDESTNQQIDQSTIETNATAGKAIIPSSVDTITIKNSQITDYTLIYVTPTSSTKNNVLYVKSKGVGFFTVGFTDPLDFEVSFNWWIIETLE